MVYYPIPLYKQEAYRPFYQGKAPLLITEELCNSVLSLPIHTEMTIEMQGYIVDEIINFLT